MEQTHMKKTILLFTLLLASCFHHGEQNPPYVFKHEVLFVDNNNNLHSNLYVGLFDKGHQNPIANDNLYVEFYINVEGDYFNDTYITIQNASHKNENSYVLMTLFDFSEKKYGYSRAENNNVIYDCVEKIIIPHSLFKTNSTCLFLTMSANNFKMVQIIKYSYKSNKLIIEEEY